MPVDGAEGFAGDVPDGDCVGVRTPGDVAPGRLLVAHGGVGPGPAGGPCAARRPPRAPAPDGGGGRGGSARPARRPASRRRSIRTRAPGCRHALDRRQRGAVGHLAQRAQPAEARARGQQHRGAEQHGRCQCGHSRGLRGLPSPVRGQLHRVMVERSPSGRTDHPARRRRRSLARSLTLALVGLTIVLALAAAAGIGGIYSARQDYEDSLARAYSLEAASASPVLGRRGGAGGAPGPRPQRAPGCAAGRGPPTGTAPAAPGRWRRATRPASGWWTAPWRARSGSCA